MTPYDAYYQEVKADSEPMKNFIIMLSEYLDDCDIDKSEPNIDHFKIWVNEKTARET